MKELEHEHQAALFQRIAIMSNKHDELGMVFAIPNGGHRHIAVARKLKAEGVKSGVPDICIPLPRGQYHGCFIELKAGKNKATTEQKKWIEDLNYFGYRAEVCNGVDDAWGVLMDYLGIDQ